MVKALGVVSPSTRIAHRLPIEEHASTRIFISRFPSKYFHTCLHSLNDWCCECSVLRLMSLAQLRDGPLTERNTAKA